MARFAALELHAARGGREVMQALAETVRLSSAQTLNELAADLLAAVDAILSVMPAYAPPLNVMHRVLAHLETAQAANASADALRAVIEQDAAEYQRWSDSARRKIADAGAECITSGCTVFTFTLSETALRTLRHAAEQGKQFRVLVTESRPNQDGLHTARELSGLGVKVQVSIDACAGLMMSDADLMLVGAESIMADGSAIAKIGTYPAALAAARIGVPVYVVVDTLKFNVSSRLGLALELDPIVRESVLPTGTSAEIEVVGHLFDRTPAPLIHAIVTEQGVISPAAAEVLMRSMPVSRLLSEKLTHWPSIAGPEPNQERN